MDAASPEQVARYRAMIPAERWRQAAAQYEQIERHARRVFLRAAT